MAVSIREGQVFKRIWRARWSWLPGVALFVIVLVAISYMAGGPSVVFRYIF
jgi:hypothetical protein